MRKILIVEDNPDMQVIYKDMLEDIYNIIIVDNTGDAEVVLRTEDIKLMILDIVLPGENGDDFLVRIKENPQYTNLGVIAVTVLGDLSKHLESIHKKLICIPKPFEKEQLAEAIAKMLRS